MDNMTDKLIQYVDGELSEAEASAVETQLRTDKAYQAEHAALKRVDWLLSEASMATPGPDFMVRFEARLDHRLRRRRNMIGFSIIGAILIMAAGLLVWSLTVSGTAWLSLADGTVLMEQAVDLLQGTFTALSILFKVGTVMTGTMVQVVQHPAFWGYAFLVAGLVLLWAQLLRWVGVTRSSVTA